MIFAVNVRFYSVWLVLSCLTCVVMVADVQVSAYFEPESVALGSGSNYVLKIQGSTKTPKAQVPHVAGLELKFAGPSTSIQVINGSVMSEASYMFSVRVNESGSYTIPAYTVTIENEELTVPAATLQVISPSSMDSSALHPGHPSMILSADIPKRPLYVGEAFPLTTRLYISPRFNARLTQPSPTLEVDALSLFTPKHPPQESRASLEGALYRCYDWQNRLTPIKAGTFELAFDLTVEEEAPRQPTGIEAFFGRGFFDDVFTQFTPRALKTRPESLTVLPLPAGAPEGFSGGIGAFQATAHICESSTVIGEPITYTLTIQGQGNFDRIQAPTFPESTDLKVYAPTSTFTPRDAIGFIGTKTFEYILIPKNSALTQVPSLSWAYWDPEGQSYVSHNLEALPLKIVAGTTPLEKPAESLASPSTPLLQSIQHTEYRPIQDLGVTITSLKPYFYSPFYWIINGLVALISVATYVYLLHRRRLRSSCDYAHRLKALKLLKKHYKLATQARKAKSLAKFYDHVRSMVVAVLIKTDNGEAQTWPELLIAFNESEPQPQLRQMLTQWALAADALRYAHQDREPEPTQQQLDNLKIYLQGLVL